ncbi:MAG: ABC transporter permease [Phycisphaerae bacterium]|nr:MAG: ABC transporter permease [Phycisphaerae bacterium]
MTSVLGRYGRILFCFARNGLVRELSFRVNFLVTVISEILWLGMMLVFVQVIFRFTSQIDGWSNHEYLFLLGTHFLISSLFEAFFFGNLQRISAQIRTGDLDFVLLKPANTQFLLSFERISYTALANVPLGVILCVYAFSKLDVTPTVQHVSMFVVLVCSGVITLYSLMFMFSATSVWLIRQTSASHFWFYLTSCSKYPAEIYKPMVRGVLWFALTFVFPVLIVANLPANVMVRVFEPYLVAYALFIAVGLLLLSSLVFNWAMRRYRSASS